MLKLLEDCSCQAHPRSVCVHKESIIVLSDWLYNEQMLRIWTYKTLPINNHFHLVFHIANPCQSHLEKGFLCPGRAEHLQSGVWPASRASGARPEARMSEADEGQEEVPFAGWLKHRRMASKGHEANHRSTQMPYQRSGLHASAAWLQARKPFKNILPQPHVDE